MSIFVNPFKQKVDPKKKIVGNMSRVRLWRFDNNLPVEIGVIDVEVTKDDNENTVLINEKAKFKEILYPAREDSVKDLLLKVSELADSKETKLKLLDKKILEQQNRIKSIDKGKIPTDKKPESDWEKVNKITEDYKLRVLRVTRETVENESVNHSFLSIESDGTKTYNYSIYDGEYIPMGWKIPTVKGEVITIYQDKSLKNKQYKEQIVMLNDWISDQLKNPWDKWFKLITWVLAVILVLGNIFYTVDLNKRQSAITDREKTILDSWDSNAVSQISRAMIGTSSICSELLSNDCVMECGAKNSGLNLTKLLNQSKSVNLK